MHIYRFITGSDDSAFCHKVTKALAEGWMLYGSPSISTSAEGKTVCGQAVTKDATGQLYNPEKKLTAY